MNRGRYTDIQIFHMLEYGYVWKAFPTKLRKALKCYRAPLYDIDTSVLGDQEWIKRNREETLKDFFTIQS